MSRLKFDDISEWTPSSISIVDVPAHPLCQFEVYDDDEEFVKKSIEIPNEGEIMVDETQTETKMMTVSEGFFEKLFNRAVGKSEEEPAEKAEEVDIAKLVERIEKLEAEVKALKEEEKPAEEKPETKEETPVPGAVAKSEGESSEAEAEAEAENVEATQETIIDEEEVVIKSRSLDPDTITMNTTEKSLVERAGRNYNGMTW